MPTAQESASEETDIDAQPAESLIRIERVAARTGMTKRTLRYYEEIGLLDPPTRTEGGYRLYTEADIQRLESIKRLRDLLGFSLAEIRKWVSAEEEREKVRDAWAREADPHMRLKHLDEADVLVHGQLRLVEEKLAGLGEMRQSLLDRLSRSAEARTQLLRQMTTDE